ncbi:hypothetical protein BGZ60DRAFT_511162 [Tricladium varicosporioides]|nr:hypothetical protein BGZ60DRAFT_511162 [Hymenoscyphus varicosporioides]
MHPNALLFLVLALALSRLISAVPNPLQIDISINNGALSLRDYYCLQLPVCSEKPFPCHGDWVPQNPNNCWTCCTTDASTTARGKHAVSAALEVASASEDIWLDKDGCLYVPFCAPAKIPCRNGMVPKRNSKDFRCWTCCKAQKEEEERVGWTEAVLLLSEPVESGGDVGLPKMESSC